MYYWYEEFILRNNWVYDLIVCLGVKLAWFLGTGLGDTSEKMHNDNDICIILIIGIISAKIYAKDVINL